MGLPTSGGDERSFRPHPPLLTPVWQDLPCHSLPASKGPFSSRPKVLPELRGHFQPCACLQPLAVCFRVCSRHRVQGFQGSSEQGRRRPGPSLADSGACGGRQAYPPGLGCWGRASHARLPWVVSQASGRAQGMVGPEVVQGDPVRASPRSWVPWGRRKPGAVLRVSSFSPPLLCL